MLWLATVAGIAGCTALVNLPLPVTPAPTASPEPTWTPTPAATTSPTATPTPLPAITVLTTPAPRDPALPEPTPAGSLIAYTDHVDFYAEPGSYWALRIAEIGPAIEGALLRVADRLDGAPPNGRVTIAIQDPSTSPLVRGMDCPARGLYYGQTEIGRLMIVFADADTSWAQVLAVAAHELAHGVTVAKLGDGGDIILSEGLANWASRDTWSAWQGWPSFDAAVREYRRLDIYLPLEETLTFDPDVTQDLGLRDCFALRDLRYNEWASFVGYLVEQYGWEAIAGLWNATPERPGPLRRVPEPGPVPGAPRRPEVPVEPGSRLPARPQRETTVDYAGVLDRDLRQLEQEWLRSLSIITTRRGPAGTQSTGHGG